MDEELLLWLVVHSLSDGELRIVVGAAVIAYVLSVGCLLKHLIHFSCFEEWHAVLQALDGLDQFVLVAYFLAILYDVLGLLEMNLL